MVAWPCARATSALGGSMIRPIVFAAVSVFALGLAVPAHASPVRDPAKGSVHIDFVRYDPAGSDTGSNINKEIVVIKDGTGKARILTGWTLRDRCACGHVYHFRPPGSGPVTR
jgi:hypothetical protein